MSKWSNSLWFYLAKINPSIPRPRFFCLTLKRFKSSPFTSVDKCGNQTGKEREEKNSHSYQEEVTEQGRRSSIRSQFQGLPRGSIPQINCPSTSAKLAWSHDLGHSWETKEKLRRPLNCYFFFFFWCYMG